MTTAKTQLHKAANSLIAANVKRLVKKRGWTLERLAFDSDLDKGNVYNMVNGRLNFTLRTVVKFAETLEVELAEFFKK
jgi:transcriptional regulator with XRE-family HTH domain